MEIAIIIILSGLLISAFILIMGFVALFNQQKEDIENLTKENDIILTSIWEQSKRRLLNDN